jgi:very-short-patch-repair endonuclease
MEKVESPGLNKVLRLFNYLEKALSLDDSVIRDFRTISEAPSPWWLADLPTDVENLTIKSFETEKELSDDQQQTDAWLRVEKKNVKEHPALPKNLIEWIQEINPLEKPKAKEKIDRKVRFDQDESRVQEFKKFKKEFKSGDTASGVLIDWVVTIPNKLPELIEERYFEDQWTDHQELHLLLEDYSENEWKPWADQVKKIYQANLLYDQLYALRLLLKNEGDNYELLLGQGLLTWKHAQVGTIYAPMFLTPLTLDFDPSKRVIEISPDPMFRGFVEISSLYQMENAAEMDLITWSDKINASPFNFWHLETLKTQASVLINYLSTEGEDRFTKEIVTSPDATKKPSIWNAPVIFARKRTNDLWSKYAGIIRRDIEQNIVEPTEFITDLVGEYQEEKNNNNEGTNGAENSSSSAEASIKESELFFPLPWNDEQQRIAERLESHYGVVVKGPPGTGKSHTIANLISRFLAQGKSVLVTSQTSKALEVLREKLPEDIRSLAVSQLHQTAKRDGVLQQSITEISSNLGERHTKFSESKSEAIRKDIQRVREERALFINQIQSFILTDSNEKIVVQNDEVSPLEAAKIVSLHEDDAALAWFTDKIPFEVDVPFKEDDLLNLYVLTTELPQKERDLYKYDFHNSVNLPKIEAAAGAFAAYRDLNTKIKTAGLSIDDLSLNLNRDELLSLTDQLSEAKKILSSINEKYEQEIFGLCAASKNEEERWKAVFSKIKERSQVVTTAGGVILGHKIANECDLPLDDQMNGMEALKKKAATGKIGTFGKLLLSSSAKRLLEKCTIDGHEPDTAERLEILYQDLLAQMAEREIHLLLEQGFSRMKSFPKFGKDRLDLFQLEVVVKNLERLISYGVKFASVDEFCKKTKQFSDLDFTKLEDVDRLIEFADAYSAKFEIDSLENLFTEWTKPLEQAATVEHHLIIDELLEALQKRNTTGLKMALSEYGRLLENKEKSILLKEVGEKIKHIAPNLYRDILDLGNQRKKFSCPKNLALAWKVARLDSWLNTIHDHVTIDHLQNQLERLTKKEYQLNGALVTVLAWQRQIDKVTKKQRDALMAWSHEMKKYGKGTGKYAPTHLRAAQEALKEAKNAVPVWIMPLHRAAQMFSEPKAGMFDVVIFDEASQCDIRGITIGYLGKKLLVVGDPEQISPAGVFQDQEKIFELISRFLFDVPFKDSFSITSSLFDLARIRLSNIIQLNEHFRCVPEIIAFSNHHIYEGKLKPLRYPNPKGLLKPALVPVFVQNGYQNTNNKVNPPEAEAIVAKLLECLKDPRYQKRPNGQLCTFGIISLLAEDQAKYIEKLLRDMVAKGDLSEKVIEERRIECGDAYRFQGDERDVMFLSMVGSLNQKQDSNQSSLFSQAPGSPKETVSASGFTDDKAKQRFNVAASRARDQMFIFHSIPLESFNNTNDWRYKILNWFYDPKQEELNAGREALKREFNSGRASQFSFDVGNILIDRGYQVLPEYPVIGYRIDLVIQGTDARLAVECDGDQYHTLENFEADQSRERQLRRAGWEFWRVTGSAFYRHKEKALDSLWKKMDEMGIKPIVER